MGENFKNLGSLFGHPYQFNGTKKRLGTALTRNIHSYIAKLFGQFGYIMAEC